MVTVLCDPKIPYYVREDNAQVLAYARSSDFFSSLWSPLIISGSCCFRCLRPCATTLQVVVHYTYINSFPVKSVCTHIDPEPPISQALLTLSDTHFEGLPLPGVVSTTLRCPAVPAGLLSPLHSRERGPSRLHHLVCFGLRALAQCMYLSHLYY